MAVFPNKESDVFTLAQVMITGLSTNTEVYPAPPIVLTDLSQLIGGYAASRNALIAATATAQQATADKDVAFDELKDALKQTIRYAENTVNYDDEKLKLIGWAGRKSKTALSVPGQTRLLEVPSQGDNWVFLDWKKPADGGKVVAYKVMRRERPEGSWQDVATAIESEANLADQPRGVELEYRVVAINKAGQGEPSNTVMVVL